MKNKDQHIFYGFIHIPPYLDCREPKTSVSFGGKWYRLHKDSGCISGASGINKLKQKWYEGDQGNE